MRFFIARQDDGTWQKAKQSDEGALPIYQDCVCKSLEFPIMGTRYYNNDLKKGQALFLKPDPNNQYDKNAIAVVDELGETIGYMPMELNKSFVTHSNLPKEHGCLFYYNQQPYFSF